MLNPRTLHIAAFALLAPGMALAGCRHIASAPAAIGQSSFEFVPPPPPPPGPKRDLHLEIPENEEYNEAKPILPLAEPVYPPAALTAHAGSCSLEVRLTIDTDGRVADVEPSLVSLALPGPFSQAFRDSIQAAVGQWKFHPAELIYLEPAQGSDSSVTYLRVNRREKVAVIVEVVFTFTAEGKVLRGPPEGAKDH